MTTISEYNKAAKFTYDLRESRLQKCLKIIDSIPCGKFLDIGCSNGDWASLWQARGWCCSGVDIDQEHLEIARQRGIDARYCDLNHDSIPFGDECFDLIFAGEVIEHLVDTDKFLGELRRCLRASGHLLITTPNLASFENRLRIALGMYPIWVNYNLAGSGHVRAYTPRALEKQLRDHGFRVVLHRGNWVPFIPQHYVDDIKLPFLAITGDLFPGLSMDVIMLAQRVAGVARATV